MGVYQTTRCGVCNHEWGFMRYGGDSVCGPPLVKCVHCKSVNKTNMKLYSDMTTLERILFWFGQGFQKPFFGLLGFAAGIAIIKWLYFSIDENGQTSIQYMISIENGFGLIFFHSLPLLCFWFGYILISDSLSTKRQLNQMEATYKGNGGFLWSNEQY